MPTVPRKPIHTVREAELLNLSLPVEVDWEFYEEGSMPPGIGYSEDRLHGVLQHYFEVVEFRPMKVQSEDSGVLGMDGLWVILMKPLYAG